MSPILSQTSAAARSIAEHSPVALTRTRALLLDQRLASCAANPAPCVLRQIVIAIRDLVGPGWLARHADDPAIRTFAALDSMPAPPPLPVLDHTLASCLQARFNPPPSGHQPGGRPPVSRSGDGRRPPTDGAPPGMEPFGGRTGPMRGRIVGQAW